MAKSDLLSHCQKTTLWLRMGTAIAHEGWSGSLVELDVWLPLGLSADLRVAILAKHAGQGVRILRQLTGSRAVIVQGQYVDAHRPGREVLVGAEGDERRLSVAP